MSNADQRVQTIVAIGDPDMPGNVYHPSYVNAAAVVKSDVTVFAPGTSALWVGGAGDVVVRMTKDQSTVTFTAVPAGSLLKISVDQVKAATSATNIVRLF